MNAGFVETAFPKIFQKEKIKKESHLSSGGFKKLSFLEKILPEPNNVVECTF
jgi:hypothetical protein